MYLFLPCYGFISDNLESFGAIFQNFHSTSIPVGYEF